MEKSAKRGKIPQSDWPLIMARYEAGETLASIARTYDCSPPAISYVVSRSRARPTAPPTAREKPPVAPEPQLVKGGDGSAPESARPAVLDSPPATVPAAPLVNGHELRSREPRPEAHPNGHGGPHQGPHANGFIREHHDNRTDAALHEAGPARMQTDAPAPQVPPQPPLTQSSTLPQGQFPHANGDHRRTLHLSLGGHPHDNGSSGSAPEPIERPPGAPRVQETQAGSAIPGRSQNGAGGYATTQSVDTAAYENRSRAQPESGAHPKANGNSFIDQELRTRVEADITAFLAAFDGALAQDTPESRSALREATDRLLRAGARTRIELERLEARIPLPVRDNSAHLHGNSAWRGR